MKLLLFVCLLGLALSHELYTYYTPGLGYYAPGLGYTRTAAAVVPLAYSRLIAPGAQSHVYNSVETPNSFQQQYRTDYKPVSYEYIY
ncbi:uncharacterized protein LOC115633016 [Scaptodrosophila lebanonensis]|uniref:Uncharacterized protein LOC115633016 n=1 Tax=Drosophila lebanonensis TaxID=7225 RepID=A0A6J2UCV9_DROLE|nr:uncharacterized protein LOC115633016 [Scaptodrosophila lebanonensis]